MTPDTLNKKWNRFEKGILSRLDPSQKKLWGLLVFLTRFMMLAIPFNFLIWVNFDTYPLQVVTAKAVSGLLSLSGVENQLSSTFITVFLEDTNWRIEIIKDCIGWKSFMAVAGLMFAVRGVQMRRRIAGIIAAAPVVYVGNILRIFSSIYVPTAYGQSPDDVLSMFNTIHEVLWQGGLIALVIAIWWVWLEKIAYKD